MGKPRAVCKDVSSCFHLAMATRTLGALCREEARMSVSCRRSITADSCDRRYFDHYCRIKRYIIIFYYIPENMAKIYVLCFFNGWNFYELRWINNLARIVASVVSNVRLARLQRLRGCVWRSPEDLWGFGRDIRFRCSKSTLEHSDSKVPSVL